MKTWILAAGLLSIAPVSDLLVSLSPPPAPVVIEERGIGYSPKDHNAMSNMLDKVDRDSESRRKLMMLYPDGASQEEVEIASSRLTDQQKGTRLWGKFTRWAKK